MGTPVSPMLTARLISVFLLTVLSLSLLVACVEDALEAAESLVSTEDGGTEVSLFQEPINPAVQLDRKPVSKPTLNQDDFEDAEAPQTRHKKAGTRVRETTIYYSEEESRGRWGVFSFMFSIIAFIVKVVWTILYFLYNLLFSFVSLLRSVFGLVFFFFVIFVVLLAMYLFPYATSILNNLTSSSPV